MKTQTGKLRKISSLSSLSSLSSSVDGEEAYLAFGVINTRHLNLERGVDFPTQPMFDRFLTLNLNCKVTSSLLIPSRAARLTYSSAETPSPSSK